MQAIEIFEQVVLRKLKALIAEGIALQEVYLARGGGRRCFTMSEIEGS